MKGVHLKRRHTFSTLSFAEVIAGPLGSGLLLAGLTLAKIIYGSGVTCNAV